MTALKMNLGHFFWLVINELHDEKNLRLAFFIASVSCHYFLKLFYLLTITVQGYRISIAYWLIAFLSFVVLENKVAKNSCKKG